MSASVAERQINKLLELWDDGRFSMKDVKNTLILAKAAIIEQAKRNDILAQQLVEEREKSERVDIQTQHPEEEQA